MRSEIERTEAIGAKQIVLHPGAHVGAGAEEGIKKIIEGLNEVLTEKRDVQIALETMAGKGSECGCTFDEIAKIIDGVTHNERLSVCFDTCHTHDAGYDIVNDFDGVLDEFDRIIGAERIKVVHVNDSKMNAVLGKTAMKTLAMAILALKRSTILSIMTNLKTFLKF